MVVLLNSSATGNTVSDLVIDDGPAFSVGAIVISSASNNIVERISMSRAASTCIGITGATAQYNTIRDVTVLDCGSFGVRLGESANRNLITNISTYRNGHELVGLAWGANHNTITNSYAQDTGDNGFSVSGDYNTLTGNRAYAVAKAGFGVWGSFNSLAGNVATNNNQLADLSSRWSGFWISNGYGGCGSYNSVTGTTDDTQTQRTQSYGMLIGAQGYTLWAAGQSITVGLYRYFGTNVYQATSAGTTSSSGPTCTSGTCSDGAVTWGYKNTCIQQVNANNNVLAGTAGRSYYGVPWQDTASAGLRNTIYGNRYTVIAPVTPGYVNIKGLPTSAAGLASGTLWNNANVLNVVP
jgi:parallel beta-helix repeat protein